MQPLNPPRDVLNAFGITVEPVLLHGGQGITWRAGDIVLKPTSNEEESVWCAEVIESLSQESYRCARHRKTTNGTWVYGGWEALEFIEGYHLRDRWEEKITVCNGFNAQLATLPKPPFIDKRTDPWAIASKMAWGELPFSFDERLTSYVEKVWEYLQPFDSESQIVHGDITGNMLFSSHLPPGIIDFTPIFRPKEYALSILIVDALTWEGADDSILALIRNEKNIFQCLLRAALFRTLVTSEFYRQHDVDRFSELPKHDRVLSFIVKKKEYLS